MRTAIRTLALALAVSTGALWAQTQTAVPQSSSDEPATAATAAQPTEPNPDATANPPATANPANQESDALPQSGATQSTESTTPSPVTEEPLSTAAAPPAENPKPAEPAPQPKRDMVSGTVVSSSASELVIQTSNGAKLTFVVDNATTVPELHAKDAVSVEYMTLADGTRHADRVTLATPRKAAVAAAPRQSTPPAPKKPVVAPAAPIASVAVTPAPAPEPTPAPPVASEPAPTAEPLASATTPADSPENHSLNSDTPAVNPLVSTKAARDFSPTRMIVPVVLFLGGLLFITVLGVRQARREA